MQNSLAWHIFRRGRSPPEFQYCLDLACPTFVMRPPMLRTLTEGSVKMDGTPLSHG